ncbi:hypothetical protein HY991_05065 [Candidatus Micrarchaeota archaeon]|nr:hypothetical protein [Candidatus Micrarchaeota archaeon]
MKKADAEWKDYLNRKTENNALKEIETLVNETSKLTAHVYVLNEISRVLDEAGIDLLKRIEVDNSMPLPSLELTRVYSIESPKELSKEFGWISFHGWAGELASPSFFSGWKPMPAEKVNEPNAFSKLLWLNSFGIEAMVIAGFKAYWAFEEVAKQQTCSIEDVLMSTLPEIWSGATKGNGKRKGKYGLCKTKDGPMLVDADELLKLVGESEKPRETFPLKGQGISKGKVTGIAKVVIDVRDFNKVNLGDVLVTPMTNFDFVPILGKVNAVVTDGGGSLCHAAIICREMRKPGVVGTRVATKVIKDGMLIQVDAESGEVYLVR